MNYSIAIIITISENYYTTTILLKLHSATPTPSFFAWY